MIKQRSERRLAEEIVQKLRVKTSGIDEPITSLSGGNQQKAIIGRWLLTRPKVLLLDDPTRGVDVGGQSRALLDDGPTLPGWAGNHCDFQ